MDNNLDNIEISSDEEPKKKTAKKRSTKKTTTPTQAPKVSDNSDNTLEDIKPNVGQVKSNNHNDCNVGEKVGAAIFCLGIGFIGGMLIYGTKKIIDKMTE